MEIYGNRGRHKEFPKEAFTEYNIQQVLAVDYLNNPKYTIFNLRVFDWESDFLAFTKAGYSYEVEIKITVADFKNDMKKENKHNMLRCQHEIHDNGVNWFEQIPNHFSYCVPWFITEKVKPLLPSYAGLVEINKFGRLNHIVGSPELHHNKLSEDTLRLKKKFYYAYIDWYNKYKKYHDKETEYRSQISWLKAEYKAATGYSVEENL